MRTLQTGFVAGALVFLGLFGCSVEATKLNASVASPSLEHGWTTYDCSEDGFKISAPAAFKTTVPNTRTNGGFYDPDAPTPDAPLGDTSPKEASPKVSEAERAKGTVLKLYDQNSPPLPGERAAGLFVDCQDVGAANLDNAAEKVRNEEQGITSDRRVALPVGPAHAFDTTRQTMSGDTVTTYLYVVANGKRVYQFRFQTLGAPESMKVFVQPIMDTLRVVE